MLLRTFNQKINFEYNLNGQINRIIYFQYFENTPDKFKAKYEYFIIYKNDSIMDKIIFKDSTGAEKGNVKLTYKNNRIFEERGYWENKLYYIRKHDYIFDSYTKELIKEIILFNDIVISEIFYHSNQPILTINKDRNSIQEFYNLNLGESYKATIYRRKHIPNEIINSHEIESSVQIYGLDNKGKVISISHLAEIYNKFPVLNGQLEKIYKNGILEKIIRIDENDNEKIDTEFIYKYRE